MTPASPAGRDPHRSTRDLPRIRPPADSRPWHVVHDARLASFYTFAVVLLRIMFSLACRWEIVGRENVPRRGPLIVISNHTHFVDPPIVGASLPRKLSFMAKEELFRVPIVGWWARHYDAFPVRRGEADRQALRDAQSVLDLGLALGMFPEGTRSRDGVMRRAFPGAALIAMRAGCPIVPIAIDGSERIFQELRRFRRANVRVIFGEPFTIHVDDKARDRLALATDQMMQHIAELLPEWRRGPYRRKDDD